MKFTNYNFKIGWCFRLHTTAIREIKIKPEAGFVFVQYVLGLPGGLLTFLETLQKQNKNKKQQQQRKYKPLENAASILKNEHSIAGR